jgi:hypothetical protein
MELGVACLLVFAAGMALCGSYTQLAALSLATLLTETIKESSHFGLHHLQSIHRTCG